MTKSIFLLLSLFSLEAFASTPIVKCDLDAKASIGGTSLNFSDHSIIGKVIDEEIIFDENDPNYQYVRTITTLSNKNLTYSVEGYDYRNGLATVTVIITIDSTPLSQTTALFRIPLKEKKFVGTSAVSLNNSKDSYTVTLSCEL